MSDNTEKSGSAAAQAGSAGEGSNTETNLGSGGHSEAVSKDVYARLQTDYFKLKENFKSMENALKAREHNDLEKEGKKDEIIEALRGELTELKTFRNNTLEERKTGSIRTAIKSRLYELGLDPAKERYVDDLLATKKLEGVMYDDGTGTVIGADRFAESFQKDYEALNLFKRSNHVPDQRASHTGQPVKEFDKMTIDEQLAHIAKVGFN